MKYEEALSTVAQAEDSNQAQQMRFNYQLGAKSNPDKEVQVQALARVAGVPTETARNRFDDLKFSVESQNFDADKYLSTAPNFSALFSDPNKSRIMSDDVENMAKLDTMLSTYKFRAATSQNAAVDSSFVGAIGQGIEQPIQSVGTSLRVLGYRDTGKYLEGVDIVGDNYASATTDFFSPQEGLTTVGGFAPRYLARGLTEQFGQILGSMTTRAVGAGVGGTIGLRVGRTPAAGLTGAGIGAFAGPAAFEAMQIVGTVAEERAKNNGRAEPSDEDLAYAWATAATSGALNAFGTKYLPGGEAAVSAFATHMATSILAEGSTEAAQSLVQQVGQTANTQAGLQVDVRQAIGEGILGGTAAGAITAAVKTPEVLQPAIQSATRRVQQMSTKADKAQQVGETMVQVQQTIAASKTAQRDPALVQELVAKATEGTEVETVYINPSALAQSGVDLNTIVQLAPELETEVTQAQAEGRDIEIPTSVFAAKLANSDIGNQLMPELKNDPLGLTAKEAEDFRAQGRDQVLEEEINRVAAETTGNPFVQSRERLQQTLEADLNKTARFTEDVNRTYSAATTSFYSALGARMGVTPEEAFKQYGVTVVADTPERSVFGQAVDKVRKMVGLDSARPKRAQNKPVYFTNSELASEQKAVFQGEMAMDEGFHPIIQAADPKKLRPSEDTDPKKVKRIKQAILSGEELAPIVVNKNGTVMDGHHRLSAALDLNLDMVPILVRDYKEFLDELNMSKFAPDLLAQQNRGAYDPQTRTLALLKAADLSTYLHESGHLYLDIYSQVAAQPNAPQELIEDFDTVLTWFGIEGTTAQERISTWNSLTLDQQRPYHEQWAESTERYFLEGKAPSLELRAAFQRFRAWMLNVYRSLEDMLKRNPAANSLTPEVRGVLDRMLATSEEIRAAEAASGMEPAFADGAVVGMNENEYRNYHMQGVEATQEAIAKLETSSLRDLQWANNAQSKLLRKMRGDAASKRKAVFEETRAEIMREPINQLQTFLRRGEMTKLVNDELTFEKFEGDQHRLNLDAVKGSLGDEKFAQLENKYGRYGVVGKDGLHPDVVAPMFGYDSGAAMLNALLEAEDAKTKIEAQTDITLLQRYGDITDDRVLARRTAEATHNDARARFIATEMRALERATKRSKISLDAAKNYAEKVVARTKVRNLKASIYEAAEARAGRAAQAAVKSNDLPEAANQKRNQLLNNKLARAVYDARDEVETKVRYLGKFNNEGTLKNLTPESADLIHQVLEHADLSRYTTLKALERRASLSAWIQSQKDIGIEPDISEDVLAAASKKSYKEMTVEEVRGLYDTVRQIEHLGRRTQKVLTDRKKREFGEARDALVTHIVENAGNRKPKDVREFERKSQGLNAKLRRFAWQHIKMHAVVQQIDGYKTGGVMYELFEKPKSEAADREQEMLQSIGKRLEAAINPVFVKGFLSDKIYFPEIDRSFTRSEMFTLALHTGTEAGMQRLSNGDVKGRYSPATIRKIMDTLTEAEWKAIREIWSIFESMRPDISAKELRVNGVEPVWETPIEVTTKFGTFKGGYAPLAYDTYQSVTSAMYKSSKEAGAQTQEAFRAVTTAKGHLKRRETKVEGQYLSADFGNVINGIYDAAHDIAWNEYAIDTNRFLRDNKVTNAILTYYGDEALEVIKASRDVAIMGETYARRGGEQLVSTLRNNVAAATMGWSITTILAQPAGLVISAERLGVGRIAQATRNFATSPKETTDFVYGKSAMMRERSNTLAPEMASINSAMSAPGVVSKQLDKLVGINNVKPAAAFYERSKFYFVQKVQMAVDIPTWTAAYHQALEQGETDDMAVAIADTAVKSTQGGGLIGDQSRVQYENVVFKLFTMFYTPYSAVLQRYYELGTEAAVDHSKIAQNIGRAMAITVVPAMYTAMMGELYGFLRGEEEDDKGLLSRFMGETIAAIMGVAVGVREFTLGVQQLFGVAQFQGGYSGPAGLRAFTDVFNLLKQIGQGELDGALVKSTSNTLGSWFGLPSTALNRAMFGGYEWLAEDGNPLNVLLGPPAK